jgi:Icc protein
MTTSPESDQSPARSRRILHISDLHLTQSGRDEDGVDALSSLRRLLFDCRHVSGLDLVVVSGDITDDGAPAAYELARTEVGAFAAERRIPQVYCTGNHDSRHAFAEVLGSGHLDQNGADHGTRAVVGCGGFSDLQGLRVISLDTLVPGEVAGELGAAQLNWVARILSQRAAEFGTVLVMHHPPVDLPDRAGAEIALRDREALADVIRSSDVTAVLCGHLHFQLCAHLATVPIWVTPGVNTRLDRTAPAHLDRAVLGASATVVDLNSDQSPRFSVLHARDLRAGQRVYLVDIHSGLAVSDSDETGPSDSS